MTNHPCVFISHSSKDREIVLRFTEALRNAGISYWLDLDLSIPPGSSYASEIIKGIDESPIFLLIYSVQVAIKPDDVLNELEEAKRTGKVIIPVRLDSAEYTEEFKYRLNRFQWIDAANREEGTVKQEIVTAVSRALKSLGISLAGATCSANVFASQNIPSKVDLGNDSCSAKEIFANDFLTRLVSTDVAADVVTKRFKDTRPSDVQCGTQTPNTTSSQRRTNVDGPVSSKKEADRLFSQGKYKQVIHFYYELALRGDVEAQCRLAEMYFNGLGVKKSDTEALKWVRKAAQQGDAWAKSSLEAHSFRNKIRELMESEAFAYFWVVVFLVLVIGIIATFVWSRFL